MGTKAKVKKRADETEDTLKKEKKKKRILLFRMVRKRKRLSQSQEFLHDNRPENFKTELEIDEQEKENDVDMQTANVIEHHDHEEDGIVSASASHDGHDHVDGEEVTDEKRKTADEKKRLFSSPIKFLKNSFSLKKRRKQTDYSKFSESTDNIADEHQTDDLKSIDDRVEAASCNVKQTKKTNSNKYVRFETGDDEDKENMSMTIDEEDDDDVINNQPQSSSTLDKKKKSAKKRVAKASRKTGRVFREGMILIGRNLQYLSPMPTPHVFADPHAKKKADYTDKPKKRNYKYTASAPPAHPYGFL